MTDPKQNALVEQRRQIDRLKKVNDDLTRKLTEAVEVVRKCLNYIENTESELSITLDCGDAARAFIQKQAGSEPMSDEERERRNAILRSIT